MNIVDYLQVATFINDCPNCQNGFVGNGEGTLNVDEDTVTRTCKCGFRLTYNITNGTAEKDIKSAVEEALSAMKKPESTN